MVSDLGGLEALVRALGLRVRRLEDSLLVEAEARGLGTVGIVVTYDVNTGFVRVAVPTDVEPTEEGLRWLLGENFRVTSYKYGIDYEGFIVVIVDVPGEAVENARILRRLITEVLEGARRLMEKVPES